MKRILSLLLLILMTIPLGAVLKEKDLARTLGVLRAELEQNYQQQKINMARYEQMSTAQHARLVDYMKRSEQIALMLYSQKQDFTFDLSYACQQATDLYRELHKTNVPYDQICERLSSEIARYNGLITSLEELPPMTGKAAIAANIAFKRDTTLTEEVADSLKGLSTAYTLTPQQLQDRERCLLYAKALRGNLTKIKKSIEEDRLYYTRVNAKVEELNAYAIKCYKKLQQSIFKDGGDNYIKTLSRLPMLLGQAKQDVTEKYAPLEHRSVTYSEWRGPIISFICFFILIYIAIATALSNVIVRWVIPKRWLPEDFKDKRRIYILAVGLLVFALSVMLVRTLITRNFMLMATGLMINIAWLSLAIVMSLLLRLNAAQLKVGFRSYLPFLTMAFLVIVFRIVFIPNNLVNLIYPPLLIGFTVWQIKAIRRSNGLLPTSDMVYSVVSMFAMLVASVMAFVGYVLMAVEVMVWWMFQLAAIQTITLAYHLLERYEYRFITRKLRTRKPEQTMSLSDEQLLGNAKRGKYISTTWVYDFVQRTFVPVLGVMSVLISIWAAAAVFEMTDICRTAFFYNFIEQEGVVSVSLYKLVLVIACWFLFSYLNYLIRSVYHYYKQYKSPADARHNFTLADNVIAILVWGSYFLYALVLLQVPKSGISVVTAGLATGMGFAMKDLLENFFYGISLMTGRVRVGDYIECDGISGKVESITYQSTQLITLDGSVIAFLNSALFSKNFKNLTRNHFYENCSISIGVSYGTDIQTVRQILIDAVKPLDETLSDGRTVIKPGTAISVSFADFGDSSVDLKVWVWVLVEQKPAFLSRAKEAIYNALNAGGIEIPFPQRDIHMRS